MATRKSSAVRFLDFPLEVRFTIYHLYFINGDASPHPQKIMVSRHAGRNLVKPHVWPLLECCKQIYSEALPEYYGSKEFWFYLSVDLEDTMSFLDNFRAYAQRIVFDSLLSWPSAEELLSLVRLRTVTIVDVSFETFEITQDDPLEHSKLKVMVDELMGGSGHVGTWRAVTRLRDKIFVKNCLLDRNIRLLIRFRLYYIGSRKPHLLMGGPDSTNYRLIEYDCMDDRFKILPLNNQPPKIMHFLP